MKLSARLHVAPGLGRLARAANRCLFVPGLGLDESNGGAHVDERRAQLLDEFVAIFRGADDRDVDGQVADFVLARNLVAPPFVMVTWIGSDGAKPAIHLIVRGDISVSTDLPSVPTLSGVGSSTWVEHRVPRTADRGEIRAGDDAADATELADGVVPAGGFRLELLPATDADETIGARSRRPSSDATPTPPSPVAPATGIDRLAALRTAAGGEPGHPDTTGHDEITLEPEELGGGPLTTARLCPAGHANPPHGSRCRRCERSLDHDTSTVTIEQPVLAVAELPDGTLVELDGSTAFGRNPQSEAARRDTPVGLVRLDAPTAVSRTHALVEADGWTLSVIDCGSRSGSALVVGGDGEPIVLEPWTPHEITGGDVIYLGGPTMIKIRDVTS